VRVLLAEVGVSNSSITPTVELNAVAMKRGELAVYRPIEHKSSAPVQPYCVQTYNFRGGYYNQRSGKSGIMITDFYHLMNVFKNIFK